MNEVNAGPALGFAISALAVWRVTHLLALEDGPADAVAKARERLGNGLVGELADCFACLSVWTGAATAVATTRRPSRWLVRSLALSGAACLLERVGSTSPTTILTAEG